MNQLIRNHPEWQPNYYVNHNKKMLRDIQRDVEMVKGQAEFERKIKQQQQSWKMKRFAEVPPRVNIAKPPTDTMNMTQTSKMLIESKHYIKQNMRQVLQIETQLKTQTEYDQKNTDFQKQRLTRTPKGEIPKYLQVRKLQDEAEHQQTLFEIQRNKCPPGTKILQD